MRGGTHGCLHKIKNMFEWKSVETYWTNTTNTYWTNIGPMKDGLRGQHFPDSDAVIAAVKSWLASASPDFYERGIQALVHRWQKCVTNGDDYVEK